MQLEPLQLRPYQQEGNAALSAALRRGCRYALISIPTGGGKTPMQSELLSRLFTNEQSLRQNAQGLVVVYSKLLVEQTAAALKRFCGIEASIEQASKRADPNAKIIVASAMSLVDRLDKYDPRRPRLIVLDECHHAVASTTQKILAGLNALKGTPTSGNFKGFLTGWTATACRADGKGLDAIFDEIVYHVKIEDLINQGYLARPLGYRIHSDINLESIDLIESEYGADFDPEQLAEAIDTHAANQLIVDSYVRLCKSVPTMVFCVNRTHARHVAECFRIQGVKAVALDHRSGKRKREAALSALRNRELEVIVQVNLFNEGYDNPTLTAAILARPTSSEPLYRQMIGRVMRPCPEMEKTHCIIVDIVHNSSRLELSGLPSLFGIPPQFFNGAQNGLDIVCAAGEVESTREKHPQIDVSKIKNIEQLRMFSHIEEVYLLRPEPATELIEISSMPWLHSAPLTFTLPISPTEYVILEKNILSQFKVSSHRLGSPRECLAEGLTKEDALRVSEQFVKQNFAHQSKVLSTDAEWCSKEVSERQMNYILKHKLEFDPEKEKRGKAKMLIAANILLEQRQLVLDTEALLREAEDLGETVFTPEALELIRELKGQQNSGHITKSLYYRLIRLVNAIRAEQLIPPLGEEKITPFIRGIRHSIEKIKISGGRNGWIGEKAINVLRQIASQNKAGAA